MEVIKPSDLRRIISDVVVDMNEPVMVVGQFGGGKSEITNEVVKELGAFPCDIRLGQYESVDLHGIPAKSKDNLLVWFPPSTLPFVGNPHFPDDQTIVLILDEITSATPPVFAVAYQLINERRVGEHYLKDNVRIIALGNREIDKGVVNRMPMPLCNRMTWYELGINVEEWCAWAQTRGVPKVIIAFLMWQKNMLCTYDFKVPEKVVATPRTWMKAVKYFKSKMPARIKEASMTVAIGQGVVQMLLRYMEVWSKVTPIAEIIKNPLGQEAPTEPSMQYAMSIHVSNEMTAANADQLNKYVMNKLPPEFVVLVWRLATSRDMALYDVDAYLDVAKKYRSIFQ